MHNVYKLGNNFNRYNTQTINPNFGVAPNAIQSQVAPQVQLPAMYDVNDSPEAPSIKEAMTDGPMSMMLGPFIEHPIATLGTWLGLGVAMDKFSNACSGEYEKSLIGKATRLGDRIENSKFFQSKPMKSIGGFIRKYTKKGNEILHKSDLAQAAMHTEVQPENAMAKGIMYTAKDEIVQEFNNHIVSEKEGLGLMELEKSIPLKNLDLSKDEITFIEKEYGEKFSKLSKSDKSAKIANHITLRRLNLPEDEINKIITSKDANKLTKGEILKLMQKGTSVKLTPEVFKDMSNNPQKYHKLIEEIAKESKGKVWVGAGNYKILGPLTKPFKRKISMESIYNKMFSLGDGAKTKTGRMFSKSIQTIYRALTFGGGKLGALIFIAPGIVEMVKNTCKAEKGEKFGTAAWGLISSMTWVITFMLGGKILYGAAGLKYAGISKENIAKIKNTVKVFNEKNNNGEFKTFKDYKAAKKAAKKEIKNLKFVQNESFFNKTIKKLSGILSFDLNKFEGFKSSSGFKNMLYKIPNKGKNLVGSVLKFGLFMFAIQPILDGILHKGSNLIFGKDYDPFKDDEVKARKKEQKQFTHDDLKNRLIEAQAAKMNPQTNADNTQNADFALTQNYPKTDLSKYTNDMMQASLLAGETQNNMQPVMPQTVLNNTQNQPQNTIISNTLKNQTSDVKQNITKPKQKIDNYTYIPSSQNVIKSPVNETKENRYIPSAQAANIVKNFDNSNLDPALRRADLAEQKAKNILAGNFNQI